MQFIRENTHLGVDSIIVTEHKGVQIPWNIQTYRHFRIEPDTVLDINQFWSMRPPEIQDAIFQTYQEIYQVMMDVESTSRLNEKLTDLVAKLFSYHPFEDIMHYFNFHAKVQIPHDLDSNKEQKDYVRELTYDTKEYRELAGLTVLMKIMLPVWGEYYDITKIDEKTNREKYGAFDKNKPYREKYAALLLRKSNVLQSSAYQRLKLYIDTYYGDSTKEHSAKATLYGLSKEEVSDWLMAFVLVRRLVNSELTQLNSKSEPRVLIKHIYNFIYNLAESIDKLFGGHINEKGLEHAAAGEDDNTSVIENYKIKQEISEGVILTHEINLHQHFVNILHRIDPTCPAEQLHANMALISKQISPEFVIEEISRAIIKWVLDPVVTAEIIEYVDYNAIMSAYCITYTLLKHWGYDHIAFLLFAQRTSSRMTASTIRSTITQKQMDVLDALYVDYINDSRKRQRSRARINPAANAIYIVLSNLYGSWWRPADWESVSDYPRLQFIEGATSLPFDIEVQLADLIIHLKTNIHPKLYHFDPETGCYLVRPPEQLNNPIHQE